MAIFGLFEYNHDYGPNDLMHVFSSEELANKMLDTIVEHSDSEKSDYYVKKLEVIDSLEHKVFDVKSISFFKYDGTNFEESSFNNLSSGEEEIDFLNGNYRIFDSYSEKETKDEEAWNRYLEEYRDYLFKHNQYPETVKTMKDFKIIDRNLTIYRPTEWGQSKIHEEWENLMNKAKTLSEEGLKSHEISEELKK